jgi:glycine oxidase
MQSPVKPDVAIAGGGLIGLSSALLLAERGMTVRVVDRGDPGQASWAAAGILGPQSEAHSPSPLVDLCVRSYELYPSFVHNLAGDVSFRQNGTLHLAFTDAEAEQLRDRSRWMRAEGLHIVERKWEGAKLALFFPDEGQVDNRKLLLALRAACEKRGVTIERRSLASLDALEGRHKVVCGGSWSAQLTRVKVAPQKGELMLLDARPPECVIYGAGGYAVPRDGRTLIGATATDEGFNSTPTAAGRAHLESVALKLGIHGSPFDHWAGLRPVTPDGMPVFGRVDGAVVAAGHYRNGVLLTPISARIVASLVLDEQPPVDLVPFDPLRMYHPHP